MINSLSRWFRELDVMAYSIKSTYRNSSTAKSILGGILTFFAIIFAIYSILYFGIDIITKKNPITRFSKNYLNESKIYLTDFPFLLRHVDGSNQVIDIEKFINYDVILYNNRLNMNTGDQIFSMDKLFMEKCDIEKHFYGKLRDFYSNPLNQIPISSSYCLNPTKIQYMNGTLVENQKDLYFMHEAGGTWSQWINIVATYKDCNKTLDINCIENDEKIKMLDGTYYQTIFTDNYVDLNSYESPVNLYPITVGTDISYGIRKNNYFRILNSHIETDSGYIMENKITSNFLRMDNIRNDISLSKNIIYAQILETVKFEELNYRRYIKVQDLIANIGGLIKFVIMFGTLLSHYYSKYNFYFNLSNNLLFVMNDNFESPQNQIKINKLKTTITNLQNSNKDITPSSINLFNELSAFPGKTSTSNKKLNLNVFDYMKVLLKRKSKYGMVFYQKCILFFKMRFDVLYMFRQLLKVEFVNEGVSNKNAGPINMTKINIEDYKNSNNNNFHENLLILQNK
jgi:hypothetical protein